MNDPQSRTAQPGSPQLPKPVRGDIFKAKLDPVEGNEQAGHRPVVVVSRDSLNANSSVIIVVPATDSENPKRVYPSHAFMAKGCGGLKKDSIVKTEQIRAIQTSRFTEYYGRLNASDMAKIDQCLKIILALAKPTP